MKKENLVSVPFMVLGIVFCVCLVAANLLETKVVQLGPISVTAGLIVFPISYIINDCIAEVWGFRKARLIIWMGFLMNFMVVAMGQLAVEYIFHSVGYKSRTVGQRICKCVGSNLYKENGICFSFKKNFVSLRPIKKRTFTCDAVNSGRVF